MALREQHLEYRCSDTLLEGFFCYDDEQPGPLPTVLISHAWAGREEVFEKKAHRLAYHGLRGVRARHVWQGQAGHDAGGVLRH